MALKLSLQATASSTPATIFFIYGHLSAFTLSFTLYRLFMFIILLLPYLLKLAIRILPYLLWNATNLLTSRGRNGFIRTTEQYRASADQLAADQFYGEYTFSEDEILGLEPYKKGWMGGLPWSDNTEEITVCGATLRFAHLKPTADQADSSKRPIVFLHGNPSWSFMWRNVLPALAARGHHVYAIDWLGHGRSDKILQHDRITFELHMHSLTQFFESTGITDAVLVAHDWGGCIALCTLPNLPPKTCTSLFLLNAFLPPRPSEMSLHYGLLYGIWFLSTGILRGYMPESGVMHFMSQKISHADATGYGAPYEGLPLSAKSSIYRFGHMATGFPRVILQTYRETWLWKVCEGLAGPRNFDNLNAQARLAEMDGAIREFWRADKRAGVERPNVAVVFGERDPLLKRYKDILVGTVNPGCMVDWAKKGIWLENAGHYPVEERPRDVVALIARMADGV